MNSRTLPSFWQCYRQLPAEVRQAAREAFRRFAADPRHPSLHFHRLQWDARFWSVRVTRNYRAVGVVVGDTVAWVWIGNHEDFDRAFPR